MKKITIIFSLLLLVFLMSCDNPLKNTFEILAGEADYFPLASGNYWRYSVKLGEDYHLRVREGVLYNDRLAFRIEKREGNSYSSEYYSLIEDGVMVYTAFQGWVYILQYPFIRDGGWSRQFADRTLTFTFDSWDDVEVPAGQFPEAAKFYVLETRAISEVDTTIGEYYYWYAKNVGLVKIEQIYSNDNQLELIELEDYNIVE